MYCVKCGKALEINDRFCSGCGTVNPDFPAAGNTQGSAGFTSNQGQPYIEQPPFGQPYAQKPGYGQTVSPYQNQPDANAYQNIPPVYTPDEQGAAVGFTQQNIPVNPNEGPEIPAKSKKSGRAGTVAACIAAFLACGVIGFASVMAFKTSDVKKTPNITIKTNTVENLRPEYTFNAMNNIKEPEVILDNEYITVTTQNIVHQGEFYSSAQLQLLIKNKTDTDLRIHSDEFSVNGYEFNGSLSSSLPAGKSSVEEVYIDLKDMARYGIENINTMTLVISAEESGTYEDLFVSDILTIETRNTATDAAYEPAELLYDKDEIKIGYDSIDYDYSDSPYLHLYIENNTDIPMDFSLNDLSFNDKMINAGMYQTVYPGGKRITSTYINKENLKKYKLTDLEDIKNIEFTVKGTQKGDYKEIFSTGPLKAENP